MTAPPAQQSAEIDVDRPVNVQVRISVDLPERIDAYRWAMPIRPSLSETIRHLVTTALNSLEEGTS